MLFAGRDRMSQLAISPGPNDSVTRLLSAPGRGTGLPTPDREISRRRCNDHYASIRKNNQPVADTVVTLACGGMQVQGRTDGQGNYSLSISASGRCQLSVDNKSATVFLSREGSLYNFDVPAAGVALIQR